METPSASHLRFSRRTGSRLSADPAARGPSASAAIPSTEVTIRESNLPKTMLRKLHPEEVALIIKDFLRAHLRKPSAITQDRAAIAADDSRSHRERAGK